MGCKQYPVVGSTSRRNKWDELPERVAPKCSACGARALFSVWVETNYMRGDDVQRKACAEHKSDASALMRGEPIKANE
jgi:hypothetical protein